MQWVDNGPGWVAALLGSREELLAVVPDYTAMQGLHLGVVAPWVNGVERAGDAQFEVRALIPTPTGGYEDPVTGSLNASLAQWLIGGGLAPAQYVASQGTVLGRAGRVHVQQLGADIWVGGESVTCVSGAVAL